MSTTTATRPDVAEKIAAKPLNPQPAEPGWVTLTAPELYSFKEPGDTIAGVLLACTTVELNKKSVVQYVLGRDQKRIKILGTFDLVQKLGRRHVGCMVRIKYLGEDANVKKGDNHMRIFDVQIKGTGGAPTASDGPITDEDIPF